MDLIDFHMFLDKNSRSDVKIIALNELLGLTGNEEWSTSIQKDSSIMKLIFENVSNDCEGINKLACSILVNISASDDGVNDLLKSDLDGGKDIIEKLLNIVLNPENNAADAACMTLSNITRGSNHAQLVMDCLIEKKIRIHQLINAFVKLDFNSESCNLNHLAHLFSNLSQSIDFRRELMNRKGCLIEKLLPFIHFTESRIRRSGTVGTIRNCCFDTEYHEWLLSSEVDILPRLLLPLAGPEEFDDEEMEKLPLDLQYLGNDKKREEDNEIRRLLLEAINQLCATKHGREYLREKNAYVILREYHKWENDRSILLACENIIDILIRTEEEIGEDNLKAMTIPENYIEQFKEMDEQLLKDN